MSEPLTIEAGVVSAEHPVDAMEREQREAQADAREGVRKLALREVVFGEAPEVATLRDALQRAAWTPDDYRRVLDGLADLDGAASVLSTDGAEVEEYFTARAALDTEQQALKTLEAEYRSRVREAEGRFRAAHAPFSRKVAVQRDLARALGIDLAAHFDAFERAQREVASAKTDLVHARTAAARASGRDRAAALARTAQAHAASAGQQLRRAEAELAAAERVLRRANDGGEDAPTPLAVHHAEQDAQSARLRIAEGRQRVKDTEAEQRDASKRAKREKRETGAALKEAEGVYARAIASAVEACGAIDAKLREALLR